MAPRGRPKRGTEIPPSRWLEAAVSVLDAKGLDQFALSAVATEVGASTMALYRHFPSRDALIDAAGEDALGTPPPSSERGEAVVHQLIQALRTQFVQHPWLVPRLLGGGIRPAALRWTDATLGALLDCELTPVQAHHAWQLLLGLLVAEAAQAAAATRAAPAPLAPGLDHIVTVTAAMAHVSPSDVPRDLVRVILTGARAFSEA